MKKNTAHAVLEVKNIDEEQRQISGMATTPTPDRVGDIVEPLGVKFVNPIPLLHQHDHRSPVGFAKLEKATKDGIRFSARIPKVDHEGALKDRVDLAWDEIKTGLVRGVSIGFRAKEQSYMDDGGIRFIESEILELSLVTIPANAEATIETIKSMDDQQQEHQDASVPSDDDVAEETPSDLGEVKCEKKPGVSGHVVKLADPITPAKPFVIRNIKR